MDGQKRTKKKEAKQTDYEKAHDLVSRKELIGNVIEMLEELDDKEFHSIYSIIWSLGAKDLLIKLADKKGVK